MSNFVTGLKEVQAMLPLPTNRYFRALVIVSTIAVVVCYAWLASRLMEPHFSTPGFISETFVRTSDSHLYLYEEKSRLYPRETDRIENELTSMEPLLNWLGPLRQPLELLVDEKDQNRLLVTDSRIEIGGALAMSRGRLSKSVLKAWLLQNAAVTITASQLRLEVASDVLLAMLTGDLQLEVPGSPELLTFDHDVKPWFTYADSYSGVCAKGWRSMELAPLCKSGDGTISSLSFRPFLGAHIWRSYLSLPLRDRLPFVRHWVSVMAEPRFVSVPSLKEGWRAVVEGELETLFPSTIDLLAEERLEWPLNVEAPIIVVDGNGVVTAPGTLRAMSPELPIARARLAMMNQCVPPTVEDVLAIQVPTERVVWRPECGARKSDFIQVRPSALKLAVKRGLAKSDMKLDDFILKNAQSNWMGLADAKWDERLNAYQVRGAIQAVEMYRLGTRDTNSGATTSAPLTD